MKRWSFLPVLLTFGFLLSLSSGSVFAADEIISALVDQETTITTVVSEEVGAFDSDTGVKRQDQQQAFDKADSLDQAWKDKIDELKTPESNLSLVVDHVKPNDAQNFEFQNPNDSTDIVDVKVENVDIKDVSNTADLGTKSSDGYQYKPKLDLPGSGANTYNGDTMQDFAPVPRKYAGEYYANESQNGFGDQNSYRNGLKFNFSKPVNNFGVWVGDLETRTDGQGTPALLRLYDENSNLILEQIINPNNINTDGDQNQSICGTENTTTSLINTTGCGHNTTRYIGFTSNMPVVKTMLIIVGDDDAFPGLDENNGNTEHISFMAPSMAFFTPKTTPNFSSALSLCEGQDAASSNKSFCLNLSFAQDVEDELSPEDFNLSLSGGSASIASVTKTSANSFQLNLNIDQTVDSNINQISLSLKQDALSRIGNSLSTNLESNILSLSYVQPEDPTDPTNPTDPTDPETPTEEDQIPDSATEKTDDKTEANQDATIIDQIAYVAKNNNNPLSSAANINLGLASTGENIYLLFFSALSLVGVMFKFIGGKFKESSSKT
ncbi:MAG: hypothetical protein WAS94_02680 [Candidatus Saccharimonadales bacterium]